MMNIFGYGSKRKPLGTTSFGLFSFYQYGFFGYPFLTHSHLENGSNLLETTVFILCFLFGHGFCLPLSVLVLQNSFQYV